MNSKERILYCRNNEESEKKIKEQEKKLKMMIIKRIRIKNKK